MNVQKLNQEWDRLNVRYERLMDREHLDYWERRTLNSIYDKMRDIVSELQG